jgi:hypothetical protein
MESHMVNVTPLARPLIGHDSSALPQTDYGAMSGAGPEPAQKGLP